MVTQEVVQNHQNQHYISILSVCWKKTHTAGYVYSVTLRASPLVSEGKCYWLTTLLATVDFKQCVASVGGIKSSKDNLLICSSFYNPPPPPRLQLFIPTKHLKFFIHANLKSAYLTANCVPQLISTCQQPESAQVKPEAIFSLNVFWPWQITHMSC